MTAPTFPKLRPGIRPYLAEDPRYLLLVDEFRLGGPLQISRSAFQLLRLFNGEHSLREIQAIATLASGGVLVQLEIIEQLVSALDKALFLENDRLLSILSAEDRMPACVGSYPDDPGELGRHLDSLFVAEGGPGMPGAPGCRINEGSLRAVLVPHMDYTRGGVTYGWGFKELIERTDATLFVIIATSHFSANRFTATRQHFLTPFGRVETDQSFIDRLAEHYGDDLFSDPYAHLAEHSVELEVVLLQYLLGGKRSFRIAPLVVGSFFDAVRSASLPGQNAEVHRMLEALRKAESASNEKVCYIISGDLAHIGPKFDDPDPIHDDWLAESFRQDQTLLARAEAGDAAGYFELIAEEEDRRRICGFPPTYTVLEALHPLQGRLLHYGRYVAPDGFESVSFASMAFEQ